jgi:hypothetical protein
MLECDFCGCYSPKPGRGWVAYLGDERVTMDEPGVLIYCPPCAAAVFGFRPDVAAEYICFWQLQLPASDDES